MDWTGLSKQVIDFFNNTISLISFFANIGLIVPLIYKAYNYFTDKRYLKKVLGYSKAPVQIIHSTFEFRTGRRSKNNFITLSSVKSVNYVVGMFNKISQKYDLDEPSGESENEMNIGGFSVNKKVNVYMAKRFKNFKYYAKPSLEQKYQKWNIDASMVDFSGSKKGFQLTNDIFLSTQDGKTDYAFLIKMVKSDFKGTNGKTVHILFGEYDIGTIKAAEYLAKYYKQIYKLHKDGHYFIVLEVNKIDGSINFSKGVIDLTDQMFQ